MLAVRSKSDGICELGAFTGGEPSASSSQVPAWLECMAGSGSGSAIESAMESAERNVNIGAHLLAVYPRI